MSKRALKINFIFLLAASAVVWGFYFLRQQSPCNISPACEQCLKDVNCLAGGDCLNECAKKEECQDLLYCPNFEKYLLKNSSIELAKANDYATSAPITDIETKAIPIGAAQIYEIGGNEYKVEIIKVCYECHDGQGDFSLKINEQVWEDLKFGDQVPLAKDLELGLKEVERPNGSVVEFYFIDKTTEEIPLTPWQKTINKIKNYYHYIYERINSKIKN